jgi:hypothetical protein
MKQYIVILNFCDQSVDVFDITGVDFETNLEEYLWDEFNYDLSNSQWMVTTNPKLNQINY